MDAGLHHAPGTTAEVVLVVLEGSHRRCNSGNDVFARFRGRSAASLESEDNNASTAIGPFIRFFDGTFDLDTVRRMEVRLTVDGPDGFRLNGTSSMAEIARDPADLVGEMMGEIHQYPDGAVLFLGTMFAPTEDRDTKGMGFTHKVGDIVTIRAPELGSLVNRMTTSDKAPPWTFGTADLMRNLARRGLL